MKSSCFRVILLVSFLLFITTTNVQAARTIDSVTLNGATSTSVASGGSISAGVRVTTTGSGTDDDWRCTQWRIGNSGSYTNANHTNFNNAGSNTVAFSISAPATVGTYDVSFIAYSNDACSNGPSAVYTLPAALTVTAVNHTPTNITLSANQINENKAIGTTVGNFSTTDADSGDTFTYTLVSGTGSTNNSSFIISGNQLKTNAVFDYETKNSYTIRVRTTDQGGLSYEKSFTITVRNVDESFSSVYSSNVRGGFKIIGNTSLCKTNASGVCIEPNLDDTNDGTTERNQNRISYADFDGDSGTFNSTSANMNLPSGSKILFAKLYWQGYQDRRNNPKNQVKFKKPGGTYQTLTATRTDTLNGGDNYQSSIDITSLIDTNNPNGTYFVANVAADVYADNTTQDVDNYAAWAMFIVYEDPNDTLKNISMWDGYKLIGSSTIYVDGFRTPLSGPIRSTFSIFSTEGDYGYTGDYVQINGTRLFDGLNPNNNLFNSSISSFGSNVTERTPNWQNTLGIDVDEFDVSHILTNNQTDATITLGTSNDTYYVSAFAFATEIYSPAIGNFEKNATVTYATDIECGGQKDLRGATIDYTLTFENTGTEAASDVQVYDDLEANGILQYIDMSQTLPPVIQKISGDDTTMSCGVTPASVYCDLEEISIGSKFQITFRLKVKETVNIGDNDIQLSNTAYAHYYNAATGEEITQLASSNTQMAGGICAIAPVLNYRMDEAIWQGTTGEVKNNTINLYHGTAQNGVYPSAAKICNGGYFTAASMQSISVPPSSRFQFTEAIAFSTWIKRKSIDNRLQNIYTHGQWDNALRLQNNNRVLFQLNLGGTTRELYSSSTITDTDWHHVVATYDGSVMRIYIDGIENSSASYTGAIGNSNAFYTIGKEQVTGNNYSFNGMIDELKVFDQSLSTAQILLIYTNEANGLNYDGSVRECPGGGLLYTFDECTSGETITTIQDTLGSNHAAASGNVTCVDTGNGTKGARFDGTTGYAISDKALTFSYTRGFTVCARMRIEETTNRSWAFWYGIDDAATCNNNGFHWLTNMRSSGDCGNLGKGITQTGPFCGPQNRVDISANLNKFTTYAVTYDATQKTQTLLIDNVVVDTQSSPTDPVSGDTKLTIGRPWSGCGGQDSSFKGIISALKIVPKTLDEAGVVAECTFLDDLPQEETSFAFDAWDTFRTIDDRNISTKIVNRPFSLTVASLNETNDALKDFNGTVCVQIMDGVSDVRLSRQCKAWDNLSNDPVWSFSVSRAVSDTKVKIAWKKDDSSGTFEEGNEDNSTFASDRFAIRPASFSLTAPDAVAGVDFDINITAPVYGTASPSPQYNESAGGSFDFSVSEHTSGCPIGTFNPPLGTFSFLDGAKTFTTRYDEVGVLDINISDLGKPCDATFARIDCDDRNVHDGSGFTADLIRIGQTVGQIRIVPHHFDLNATLSDFGAGTFTYLSGDMNMSALLALTATAKNAEGNTTRNYDPNCYAKATTLTLGHTPIPDPLSRIHYSEALSSQEDTLGKANDIVLDFNASVFAQGSAPFDLRLNFDRDASQPLNPFDFNITSALFEDIDGVNGTTVPEGSATFVYGRIRAYDITTNQLTVPVPVDIEIYAKNSTHALIAGKPSTSVNWYRNTDHNGVLPGSVFSGDAYDPLITVDVTSPPAKGVHPIDVTYTGTDAIKKIIHLDIPAWLWYSTKSYSGGGTDCTVHPCFVYEYTPLPSDILNDQFRGSDFQMTPAKDVSKKGAKIFR